MAVDNKSIKFLDKQTSLPVSDFTKQKSNAIVNNAYSSLASTQINSLTASISAGLPTAANSINLTPLKYFNLKSLASNPYVNNIRASANSVFHQGMSLGQCYCDNSYVPAIDQTAQNGMLQMFSNNPSMLSIVRGLSSNCLSSLVNALDQSCSLTQTINGVPITPEQAASNCNLSSLSAILNNITNGAFGPLLNDRCAEYRQLVGLSVAAASAGLPGSFTAIAATIADAVTVNMAGSTVIKNAAQSGNYNLMSDVANSTAGPQIKSMIPGVAKLIGTTFTIPPNTPQSGYKALADSFDATQTILDGSFIVGSQNGSEIPSVKNINGNPEVVEIYAARTMQSTFINVADLVAKPTTYSPVYANTDYAYSALET